MRMIHTVTGSIPVSELGAVLAHEHFVFGFPGWDGDLTLDGFQGENRQTYIDNCKHLFERLKAQYGVKTVIDATPNECGRDVVFLKELSEHLGINIICATGYYSEENGSPAYFNNRKLLGCDIVEEIRELMDTELYMGIGKTGIKAGVIKLASSTNGITPYERCFFEAACRIASKDPDIRIITHLSGGTAMEEQARFFVEHGVSPEQVCIGHMCGNSEIEAQIRILKQGFYGGYDRFGLVGYEGSPTDKMRMSQLIQLFKAGCGHRLMISTDRVGFYKGRKTQVAPEVLEAMQKNQRWEYIFDELLPNLVSLGLSNREARSLVEDNPAAFLMGESARR